jgi:uncharacterized protein (DUF2252 family)
MTMKSAVRLSPVGAAVLEFNRGRKRRFLRQKFDRMAQDPFSFFRATDHLYAASWPELRPPDAGPEVLLCGDLHLENFGAYRTEQGDFRFDINDFDEAAVAPCSLDLVRCATSIVLASELWHLTPTQATGMALTFLDQYRAAVAGAAARGAIGEVSPRGEHGPIPALLSRTAIGTQDELLRRKTKVKADGRRIIRRSALTPRTSPETEHCVRDAIKAKYKDGGARMLDVRWRLAGLGSLGLRRFVVLMSDPGGDGDASPPRLLDIKEACPSSVRGVTTAPQPELGPDEASRTLAAQVALQGHRAAGLDTITIGGRPCRIHELIPAENRASLDHLQDDPARLRAAVEVVGRLTAWSHLRGTRFSPSSNAAADLSAWCTGPALDSVLAAAARYADRTNRDFDAYQNDHRAGLITPDAAT